MKFLHSCAAGAVLTVLLSIVALAQCPPNYPAPWSPYSVSSIAHANANSGQNPPLAIGSNFLISGYFPGISPSVFLAAHPPVTTYQGVTVYVGCTPARMAAIGNTYILVQVPPGTTIGTHTITVTKSLVSGYIYQTNRSITRWAPAFQFGPAESYGQANRIQGLIFARNGISIRLVGFIQAGVSIKQTGSNPVQPGERIILQIIGITGAYVGGSSVNLSANVGGIPAPNVTIGDAGGAYSPGTQHLTIEIPFDPFVLDGYWGLSFSAGGSTVPLPATLWI